MWIRIANEADRVTFAAHDDGSGAGDIRDGTGLTGMRRRMRKLRVVLPVNRLVPGRFEVRAELSLGEETGA